MNYEWYPRNDLTRVLFCSSKYTLFLRTCTIQHDGRSLEKIFLSAALVGCFASKYTIILFLVRVRNTVNTSKNTEFSLNKMCVDTHLKPNIVNIDCCNSNIIQCYQLKYLHLCLQQQHIMDVPSGIVVDCLKRSILWFAIMREVTIYISHETTLQSFTLYPQGVVCLHLVGEYVPNFFPGFWVLRFSYQAITQRLWM